MSGIVRCKPWRVLIERGDDALPARGEASIQMRAAHLDDDIATRELRIFPDPVAGMCQFLSGMAAHQRGVLRVEVNHCVLQRHLRQGFMDYAENDLGLHDNGLMGHLAGNFERQRQKFISHGVLEFGNTCLKAGNGLRQLRGKLPSRCFCRLATGVQTVCTTRVETCLIAFLPRRFAQTGGLFFTASRRWH